MSNLNHSIYQQPDPITPDQFAQARAADKAAFENVVWPTIDAIARRLIENPFESAEDIEWERRQRLYRLRVAAQRD